MPCLADCEIEHNNGRSDGNSSKRDVPFAEQVIAKVRMKKIMVHYKLQRDKFDQTDWITFYLYL